MSKGGKRRGDRLTKGHTRREKEKKKKKRKEREKGKGKGLKMEQQALDDKTEKTKSFEEGERKKKPSTK